MEKTKQEDLDFIFSKFSEVVRDKLEGHSDTVNSVDILDPSKSIGKKLNTEQNYLSKQQFHEHGLLLSASADKTMAIWDLRLNKRIMMIQDSSQIVDEIVKAKFMSDSHVICATSNVIGLFDIRKPAIILKKLDLSTLIGEDEVNDIDVNQMDNGVFQVTTCDDLGQVYIHELDLSSEVPGFSLKNTLKSKHTNICFKTKFSKNNPSIVYSAAFDYKLVQWNLKDLSKSSSKSIIDIMKKNFGEDSLHYNPPFIYSMDTYQVRDSEFIVVGLGNGCILRFKKKNLALEEIDADIHRDQISALIIDKVNNILITGSNDLTVGFHRMSDDRLIEQTLLKVEVENKINDMAMNKSFRELYVADLSKTISKFTIRQ
ncbi:wd40 repeat-containing protein [Stylonychia lemnae]|uniref:Wd40 repeat-containing protein n=1 Tax=Stylonychia lemnae TaxID=5949 RepID=A0A078AEA6_STYLE|nr:wd40 repeat-containing protein [Stylonychia lemnae]|eukprot:CDW79253.1 wd40 repeat-containing protein [Stylonychia lemnae]